jgi:predicted nucleotidyltransferase
MTTTSLPQTPLRFGLPDTAIQAIQQVLAAHPEVEQAIVYGSRALGRQRPASDIDLTLIGPTIGFGTLARIESELDDLLLPWMIDLSRLADLSHPPLLAHIERVGQVLYHRGDGPDGHHAHRLPIERLDPAEPLHGPD